LKNDLDKLEDELDNHQKDGNNQAKAKKDLEDKIGKLNGENQDLKNKLADLIRQLDGKNRENGD